MDANELQQRNLEHLSMDNLYMSCWGLGAFGSKNVSKSAKQVALAFIKRTLARCTKFEEMGVGCFQEPIFKDIFLSASYHSHDLQALDLPTDDHKPFTASQISKRGHER